MELNVRLNIFPLELVREINNYIPLIVKIFLNKTLYLKHHALIKPIIDKKNAYDNYIRDIIRKDLDFVFHKISLEHWKVWVKNKKFTYKNKIFTNYIHLLENLCIETESTKCRNIILFFLEKSGLSKNQHKNKVAKVIKREWSN